MPRERRHVLRLFALYLGSLVVHAATAVLDAAGLPGAAAAGHLLATLVQGVALISLAGVLFFGAVLPALRLRPSKILRDLSVALASLAYFLYLLSTRQVDVAGIVATSAVITAVIGLSLQDFLTNVMGGLALQLDQSVRVGDWVKFGETSGVVREVSWRQVAVETRNGDTLVIPNTQLMRNPILLLGRRSDGEPIRDRRWVHFHVDNHVAPTAVEHVPVFSPLTPEEKSRLAAGLVFAPYAAGETIVAQGAPARHLYVLAAGAAEVRVSVEGSAARVVATLTAPDVFGEMGLLLGEARRATVIATADIECWRVTKEAFQGILAARPALAVEISRILAHREVELTAVREGLSEEAKRARLEAEQRSLLRKIRGFFGIE